mmetsp:Transcript_22559/g.64993  ORF Transcript_22559/g.64993 Transcript_22559/m.64993 type:complete len:206 (-) Transcript_22559:226-843(-)
MRGPWRRRSEPWLTARSTGRTTAQSRSETAPSSASGSICFIAKSAPPMLCSTGGHGCSLAKGCGRRTRVLSSPTQQLPRRPRWQMFRRLTARRTSAPGMPGTRTLCMSPRPRLGRGSVLWTLRPPRTLRSELWPRHPGPPWSPSRLLAPASKTRPHGALPPTPTTPLQRSDVHVPARPRWTSPAQPPTLSPARPGVRLPRGSRLL